MNEDFLIKKMDNAKDLPLPKYMTEGSAGMDLYANVFEKTIIPVGKIKLIPLGISTSIPIGYEVQVRPRSGNALKHGISMVNGIGTIDADYRGEISAILINVGEKDFVINRGDRVAQMIINKISKVNFIEVENLDKTERGESGFGHTGKN